MAFIFMFLTALFTVQPLIIMNAQHTTSSETGNSCQKVCDKTAPDQQAENKNCDTTTRCNASSCCFVCQYLPAEESLYKNFWSTSNTKLNPHYTAKPVSGYSTDCWQPPELFFV
ncbi:hypothetical protein [Sediminibacterium sp.]|uniref:hypothetical protein n=1 Tax=Sediminibacterium sp. TaxID=1917865 RepID=UPI0025D83008|nr:hypothetical protein [Sediminibacterium sp.]MBW0177463.1 hypothetical protein [Sediminibacterium sp.]